MNYDQIVSDIFSIIFLVCSLLYAHFILFAVIGAVTRKTFPKAQEQLKYGLIIPARNEEKVVGNLIKSIQQNRYPQEKLHIFVIAHNCTDKTAEIARNLGATVYEYNNPDECTMGYAFKHLFERIAEDYGILNYDGFFLFNADNVLSPDYFEKMNDAFVANHGECVITSFRNSKNFGSNWISGLYGIYFMTGCRMEMRGRTVCNISTRVSGTGYVVNSKLLKDGWPYVTLTEDWEFTADQIIGGTKVLYCDEAEFFDEQPTKFKIMWRQRVRWSRGHLLICVLRLKDLVKSLFSHAEPDKKRYRCSLYDYSVNILPFCLILTSLTILQYIVLLFSPLAGIPVWDAIKNPLTGLGWTTITGLGGLILNAIAIFVLERKRIHGVSLPRKILLCLLWPFFIMIQFPIDVVAVFSKNLSWKTIPHDDTTTIDELS